MDERGHIMKYRSDFVTNSSSSSFILARGHELSERQKDAIVRYVEHRFLGSLVVSPEDEPDKIERVFDEEWENLDYYGDSKDEARSALEDGLSIYAGEVIFDGISDDFGTLCQEIWRVLEEADDEDHRFVTIDGELSY